MRRFRPPMGMTGSGSCWRCSGGWHALRRSRRVSAAVLLGRLVQLSGLPAAAALSGECGAARRRHRCSCGGGAAAARLCGRRSYRAVLVASPPAWRLRGDAQRWRGSGRAAAFAGGVAGAAAASQLAVAACSSERLGIRPTYAPIAVLLLFYGRLCVIGGPWPVLPESAAAVLAWFVPFALWVGPQTLWA